MKFIPAIEKTISQLNLRGYEQLANSISSSTKELVDSLLEQANYCISAPLAESGAYTLMVDCISSWGWTRWYRYQATYML